MMGATVTLMRLDEELKACLDLEADSVGLRRLPT
jgi:dihydroxyacetone kinase